MLERLINIIREYTGDKNIKVDENTVLISDLGLSSLDLVNLVCAVEDEFDVEISDRAIKNFRTIGDVIAFIEQQ